MSQGDVRDLLSAGLVDDPLYAGSRNGAFNADCDPGDEDRSPVTALHARIEALEASAAIEALETAVAFWRGNFENMKRMRDALLSPEDRPAPSPFVNALQHGWAAARYPTERT